MAWETSLFWKTSEPIPFTVSNTVGIEMGAICALSDYMTATTNSTSGSQVAGIAASEKIASDGKTKLALFRSGIFKGYASGSIVVGNALMTTINNDLMAAGKGSSGSAILGIALETAADKETFLFELNPQCQNQLINI